MKFPSGLPFLKRNRLKTKDVAGMKPISAVRSFLDHKRKLAVVSAAATIVAGISLYFSCHYDLSGDFHGLYILRCDRGRLFDVKSDLMLGEENRLLIRFELDPLLEAFSYKPRNQPNHPHLSYSWNESKGSGYIFNYNADGTQLLTCFSRFRDSQGEIPKGLFVGGGLPYSKHDQSQLTMSATGMAHYDGRNWHHLWCNANETIASSDTDKHDPSTWTFLNSKVLYSDSRKLLIRSSHMLPFGRTKLRIDRYALFRAGENFFIMVIKIKNIGNHPGQYYYVYGDEPWVGEFGTSGGNIGWTRDLLHYFESAINPYKYSYAGMFDIGNPMIIGERQKFTGLANFIEWMGTNKPNLVYFSNKEGQFAEESQHVPLYSKDNRVIFLQWGPRVLMPQGRDCIMMAVGMADRTTKDGIPVKPQVGLDQNDYEHIFNDTLD